MPAKRKLEPKELVAKKVCLSEGDKEAEELAKLISSEGPDIKIEDLHPRLTHIS